ncbi:MAG: MFS transporter [Rhodobacter sp.]|uniref:MFS transporter n=1 Tax=Pararhodobacter sp. TaxID=2127056 RepID=UPI001E13B407|nr:MFS transporter [Pararhodobacter sp.]MCB1346014.1 MFS transporter [Paracoccaceae bacterium]MCB1410063.1 MFS transporter [Paracoccaceae bacterium]MCC0073941.1 MFS transporter [Rhodobacter sp.]HPD93966.1 MFS transporter [Pararhodobacter sp.]
MLKVLASTWALLLGLMLLMLGNGMQGTLLGIRGAIENFSTTQMSIVMSCYFIGFLFGSRLAPEMIRRVGHVRVFAALGSMISAVLILYAAAPHWIAWSLMRVLIGFSFSGVYITSESWLNNASTNETRGQALSLYLIVQMIGIIAAQILLNLADPSGYILFVIPSVLVSLAFTPILLSVAPAPAFDTTKPLSFRALYQASPLGCVGMFLLGGVFSAQFGMASVWGTQAGLSVRDLSIFVASIYVGGLVLQFPIGWFSDRMDRRKLILALAVAGTAVLTIPVVTEAPFWLLIVVGALMGGISNPLYSLLLAYVNDYLDSADMAAASAGLIFINGVGAISGPIVTGWMMGAIGPAGFFLFMALIFGVMALYAAWRMTQRRSTPDSSGTYTAMSPTASVISVEAALERSETESPPH